MSLVGIIGGVVGFIGGGPAGAVAGAAIADPNAAANTASQAAKYTVKVVEGVGTVIESGGAVIVDAVTNVSQILLNIAEGVIAFRPLRAPELQLAQQVFQNSIPLDRVVLSTIIGASNRPFTLPGTMLMSAAWAIPGIGPVLDVDYLMQNLESKYVIFIGGAGYNDALKMGRDTGRKGQTLIHELTHVWQGHNQGFQWGYVLNSAWRQCTCGQTATYAVTPGGQWRDYDAEPQATLVEDWFVHGDALYNNAAAVAAIKAAQVQTHSKVGFTSNNSLVQTVNNPPLLPYINCNIRPANPNANTVFPPPITQSSSKYSNLVHLAGLLTPLKLR